METFNDFAKKYDNFNVPQCTIMVGSPGSSASSLTALQSKEFPLLSVTVSQSIDAASSAQITFHSDYDLESSDFKTDYFKKLENGSKLAVKLGYSTPQTVFVGAINSIRADYSSNGVTINITCLDAKVALMYNFENRSFPEDSTVDKIVTEVLKPCKQYGSISTSFANANDIPKRSWVQNQTDDHQFLTQLAALTDSSFYTSGDTVYFVKNAANAFCSSSGSAPVKLGWGAGLMSFSADIDISAQIGSVTINYTDENNIKAAATYSGSDISGSGSLPNDKGNIVKGKKVEREETLVKTEKQALAIAKNIFLRAAMDYVKGSGQTIGIPDIKAG